MSEFTLFFYIPLSNFHTTGATGRHDLILIPSADIDQSTFGGISKNVNTYF